MDEKWQIRLVRVYRDATKAVLVSEIAIVDSGIEDGAEPLSDDMLILAAKMKFQASTAVNVLAFHYEVDAVDGTPSSVVPPV